MTELEAEWVRLVERDRRSRERWTTKAFILPLAGRALRRVRNAIRYGVDWFARLRDTFRGNEVIDLPDPARFLARGMAETHATGYRRVGRIVGAELPALDPLADLSDAYAPAAADALQGIVDTLAGKVDDRLADAVEADAIVADLAAAAEAFRAAGYIEANPYGADRAASTAVVSAYANGMQQAYDTPQAEGVINGLRFVGILDERTTEICRVRHGVKLPLGHWWLRQNRVPLHYNCRSVLLPIIGRFTPTDEWELPYWPVPMEGFGAAASQTVYA